jgi:CTP synthase
MESGIKADILVCRTEHEISDEIRNKLALFCNVKRAVIQSIDAATIYEVPNLMLEDLDVVALKKLDLPKKSSSDLKNWNTFAKSKTQNTP